MTRPNRQPTGSRLLGEELRRLRGGRRLEDIAAFSQSDALAATTRPLSVTTLSEIENGLYLPGLETLVTLCMVYRVAPARLIARLLEDRIATDGDLPVSDDELETLAVAALREARWPRALELILEGQRRARAEGVRIRWRLRRAVVLTSLGMPDEAVRELRDLLDSPALPKDLRGRVHLDIANAASRQGHVTDASFHCAAALALADGSAPRTFRLRALQMTVALTLRRHALGLADEAELHDALRRIDLARELLAERSRAPEAEASRGLGPSETGAPAGAPTSSTDASDEAARLALDVYQAQTWDALGNRLQAHELFKRLAERAERLGNSHLEACVLVSHAELLMALGRGEQARPKLEQAARVATDSQAVDHAFEAHFLLLALARSAREKEHHVRRCRRFLSLATSATPRMRQFEESVAAGERS